MKNICNPKIKFPCILGKDIDYVNTVCLPFDYVDEKSWAGKSLVVAGWGFLSKDLFFGIKFLSNEI